MYWKKKIETLITRLIFVEHLKSKHKENQREMEFL
jgi:hypothetical protein